MTEFYNKYIKYKSKYNNLKQRMIGGNPTSDYISRNSDKIMLVSVYFYDCNNETDIYFKLNDDEFKKLYGESDVKPKELNVINTGKNSMIHTTWGTVVTPHLNGTWIFANFAILSPLSLQGGRIYKINPNDTMILDHLTLDTKNSFVIYGKSLGMKKNFMEELEKFHGEKIIFDDSLNLPSIDFFCKSKKDQDAVKKCKLMIDEEIKDLVNKYSREVPPNYPHSIVEYETKRDSEKHSDKEIFVNFLYSFKIILKNVVDENKYPNMYFLNFVMHGDTSGFSIESYDEKMIVNINKMITWSKHKVLKFSVRQANELEYCLEKLFSFETLRDKVNEQVKLKLVNPIVVTHPKIEDGTVIYNHPTYTFTDGLNVMDVRLINPDHVNDQLLGRHFGSTENLLKGNDIVSILQSNYENLYNDTFKKDKTCVIQEIAKLENKFKYLKQRKIFNFDKEILSYIENNIKLLENYLLCRVITEGTLDDMRNNDRCSNLKDINIIFKDINSHINNLIEEIEDVKEADEYRKCSAIISDKFVIDIVERLEKMKDEILKK